MADDRGTGEKPSEPDEEEEDRPQGGEHFGEAPLGGDEDVPVEEDD